MGDPCYTQSYQYDARSAPLLNPCGGGKCTPEPAWGAYSYTCDCSMLGDFVAVNNTVAITLPGSRSGHHADLCTWYAPRHPMPLG